MIRKWSRTLLTVIARAACPPDILNHDLFKELRKNRAFNATWVGGEAEERPGIRIIASDHAAQHEEQTSSPSPP